MSTRLASDEVTDGIAAIEVHRQGTEKEQGLAAACSEALRKLQAFLEQEKANLALNLQDPVAQANVDAVENEFRRVQALAGIKGHGARNARPREPGGPRLENSGHNPPRNRGRRTIGRSGGRGGRGGGSGGR